MQHPDYKKPLQFRTVHSFIPPTPNLQQIKRNNMKLKIQKGPELQIKIMTPRSTRNLHSQANNNKKSFRNLSLLLDCETQQQSAKQGNGKNCPPKNNQLKERSLNSSNHPVFSEGISNEGISYEGKENVMVGQFNMNMKKKSKQGQNIEFKQVKSTKNKRFSHQNVPKEPLNEKAMVKPQKNMTDNRCESQKLSSMSKVSQNHACQPNNYSISIPYANEFDPSTHQNHYKASSLAAFNQSLSDFSLYVSQTQTQLQNQFISHERHLSNALNQITEQFTLITDHIAQLYQTTLNQTAECLTQLKSEHKCTMKQLQDMRKSISRYQVDIGTHFDDIVKELEFSCFEDIMTKYARKLQYFEHQLGQVMNINYEVPTGLKMWNELVAFLEDLGMVNVWKDQSILMNDREGTYKDMRQILIGDENSSSRRGA